MFDWLIKRRRRKLMAAPFPPEWEAVIRRNMAHYRLLEDAGRSHLRELIAVFIAEKSWEGCGGLVLNDEIRVTISAGACLLLLNIPHNYYENIETILVYPGDVLLPERPLGFFENALEPLEPAGPISGQVFEQGPVILSWDAVLQEAQDEASGYNIVYHEFAHKLDMQGGGADGTPRLPCRSAHRDWITTCSREYLKLLKDIHRGKPTFLDEYGATNEAEFFAVATEHFFSQPLQMIKASPELYRVLREFYGQDPATRVKNYLSGQAK